MPPCVRGACAERRCCVTTVRQVWRQETEETGFRFRICVRGERFFGSLFFRQRLRFLHGYELQDLPLIASLLQRKRG